MILSAQELRWDKVSHFIISDNVAGTDTPPTSPFQMHQVLLSFGLCQTQECRQKLCFVLYTYSESVEV